MSMRAAYVAADGTLELRELEEPRPAPGQALLRTVVSALCGSDLHRFRGARSYGIDTAVFGHETVGEVLECPGGELPAGARVLHVPFPAEGRVFAPVQLADVRRLVPVPDALSDERAVFGQQLGTVIFALRRFWTRERVPASALVVGAGPAGLLFVQLLRHLGCASVHVVEPDPHRRAMAERLGALSTLSPRSVELAVETSGTVAGHATAVEALAGGGVLGVFGLPDDEPGALALDVLTLLGRNLTVVGAMGAQGEPGLVSFREALAALADGGIRVDELVTHRGGLDDLPDLGARATAVAGGVGKVLITFTEQSTEEGSR